MTMDHCETCGRALRAEAQYCPGCGARVESDNAYGAYEGTAADRSSSTGLPYWRGVLPALVTAAAVVLIAGAIGVFLLVRPAPETQGQGSPPPAGPTAPVYPGTPSTMPTTAPSQPSGPSTTVPSYASGEQTLRNQARADYPVAESYLGYWLPQVSSKRIGSDGYDAAAIYQDYRNSVLSRPDTRFILIGSDDFTTFTATGYWVTLAAQPFSTPAQANAWCDAAGYAVQDCYAKRLSHTEGPSGNSVPRG